MRKIVWLVAGLNAILFTGLLSLFLLAEAHPLQPGAALYAVSAVDSSTAWAVGAGGTILATADGATWTPQNSRVTAALYGVSALDPAACWAVGEGGTILATGNGGLTWTRQGAAAVAPAVTGAEVDDAAGNVVITGEAASAGEDAAAESDDAGAAVGAAATAAAPPVTTATLRAVCAVSPLTVWVVGEGGVVLRTGDGGLSWTSSGGTSVSLYALTAAGSSVLAAGNNGTTRRLP